MDWLRVENNRNLALTVVLFLCCALETCAGLFFIPHKMQAIRGSLMYASLFTVVFTLFFPHLFMTAGVKATSAFRFCILYYFGIFWLGWGAMCAFEQGAWAFGIATIAGYFLYLALYVTIHRRYDPEAHPEDEDAAPQQ
ncbi:MAG: hypothetical protein WC712_00665 [Candidatus Brocadiia bacterium]